MNPEVVPPNRIGPPAVPRVADFRPARSWWPSVITALVVAVVAAVVLISTALGQRPQEPTASGPAPPATSPARAIPDSPDSIPISSAEGTGRLTALRHSWTPAGSRRPGESYLQVEVWLVCTSGRIDYDPYFFQAFDARGRLYEVADSRSAHALTTGRLAPHQQVRGVVVFDMPRGNATLMMTDGAAQAVTALRIAG